MQPIQVDSIVRHKTHKNNLCGVVRAIDTNSKGRFAIMQWTFYYFGCEEDPNYPETEFIAIPVSDLEITDPINVNPVDLKVLEESK